MNQLYIDLVISQAGKLIERSNSIRSVGHSGMQGELREAFTQDLLRPLLPSNFVVGSGKIVSSYKQTSNQIDCLIFDRGVMPPALISGTVGIFPVEATLITVEVKTTLTASELRTTHNSAALVRDFKHAPPLGYEQHIPGHTIEHVVPYVFAFDTDLAVGGKHETDRYDEICNGAEPAILGLCVVGRGFWFWNNNHWKSSTFPFKHGEIAALIAAVANTCQRISDTRRRPDFRSYLEWNDSTKAVGHLVQE